MEQQQKFSFSIRIESIDLVAFNATRVSEPVDPMKVNFNITYNYSGKPDENNAIIDLKIKVFKDSKNEFQLGSIETRGSYIIQIKSDTKLQEYPIQVIGTILGSQISTTRGMLIILSKGTPFEKAIMPIINVFDAFLAKPPQSAGRKSGLVPKTK